MPTVQIMSPFFCIVCVSEAFYFFTTSFLAFFFLFKTILCMLQFCCLSHSKSDLSIYYWTDFDSILIFSIALLLFFFYHFNMKALSFFLFSSYGTHRWNGKQSWKLKCSWENCLRLSRTACSDELNKYYSNWEFPLENEKNIERMEQRKKKLYGKKEILFYVQRMETKKKLMSIIFIPPFKYIRQWFLQDSIFMNAQFIF